MNKKRCSIFFLLCFCTIFCISQSTDEYQSKYIPRKYIKDLSKPTLVMLTATWCGPCKYMKNSIMHEPEVENNLNKMNVLIIDIDTNDGKIYAERFKKVGYKDAIPFIILLDLKGEAIDTGGTMTKEEFNDFILKAINAEKK